MVSPSINIGCISFATLASATAREAELAAELAQAKSLVDLWRPGMLDHRRAAFFQFNLTPSEELFGEGGST